MEGAGLEVIGGNTSFQYDGMKKGKTRITIKIYSSARLKGVPFG
jgi:hypothetical protein